ncbi:MAG: aspartate aminotransferase [Chloroflexi bacterium]|nr:aspartate aminotransferase [Chloroflexota bacterium]
MSDFDLVLDRRGSNSSKWGKYAGTDILPMWVADMDFKIPQQIIDAICKRAEDGIFGYEGAPPELKEVIVGRLEKLYDWEVGEEEILFLPGVVPALNQACRALVGPGESVVTATPIYYPFLSAPENWDRKLHRVACDKGQDTWPFPVEAMAASLAENSETSLLLLCNPFNPVGRMLNAEELGGIVEMCREHDVWICSDEIHCELILDDKRHIPTATISREAEDITITLMAPTKTFNLAGLGGSFAVIKNPALREKFVHGARGMVSRPTTFGFLSMLTAYRECEPWREALLDYLRANRDYLASRVEAIAGVSMSPVEATYLAWLDVSKLDLDDAMVFFEAAGVGLSDGGQFDGPGYMRLNFACPMATLVDACDRIENAANSRNDQAKK